MKLFVFPATIKQGWGLLFLLFLFFSGLALANASNQQIKPQGLSNTEWQNIKTQIQTHSYQIQATNIHNHYATNSAQKWNIEYYQNGQTILSPISSVDDYHISIKLKAINSQPLSNPVQQKGEQNILTYQWDENITEWWVNSEQGVEQWFKINQAPKDVLSQQKNKAGLALALTLESSLSFSQQGDSIQFLLPSGAIITYDKLKVWDVTGKVLSSQMQLKGEQLSLLIDDKGATYPITIDPSFVQQAYLKAANGEAHDFFATAVDIFGDTLVIGASGEGGDSASTIASPNNNSPGAGAVYVFVRSGVGWVLQAYLKASDAETDDFFGSSVAISGNTVIVGALGEDEFELNSGAAYLFTRTGTTWIKSGRLKAPFPREDDFFGRVVDISGDTVVVGAPQKDFIFPPVIIPGAGAAFVFERSGSLWVQQGSLRPSVLGLLTNSDHENFGTAVAVDGNTIIIGSPNEDSDGSEALNDAAEDAGAAYIFSRSGGAWSQQAYLKADNAGIGDSFGSAVSISGNTVVIGAPREQGDKDSTTASPNDFSSNAGSAYIFTSTSGTWEQQAYLKAANAANSSFFGNAVAIDANLAVIAAYREDGDAASTTEIPNVNAPYAGAAYVFMRSSSLWAQTAYLKASNAESVGALPGPSLFGVLLGDSVAVNGNTILVGAPGERGDVNSTIVSPNTNANQAGAAYVFEVPSLRFRGDCNDDGAVSIEDTVCSINLMLLQP